MARITTVKGMGAFALFNAAWLLAKWRTVTSSSAEPFDGFVSAVTDRAPGPGSGLGEGLGDDASVDDGLEIVGGALALGSLGGFDSTEVLAELAI